jgi:signal transduction histidine kinase
VGMASEALSILISDFGARAGAVFFASRPPLRVRRGDFTESLTVQITQWEASVEERLDAGPWQVAREEKYTLATRPVKGTTYVLVHALILVEQSVGCTFSLVFLQPDLPTGEERAQLTMFLQTMGSAVGLVSDLALTKERLSQLNLFYQVAQSMASTFDLSKVLDNTIQLTTAVVDASASALMLIDQETKDLVFEYAHGEVGSSLRRYRMSLDKGIAGWVATHGIPTIVNDVHKDPRFNPAIDAQTGFLTKSVMCVPIQIRGRTIGVLEAVNKRSKGGFDPEDLNLMLTTANQAGIAIENSRLYQSLRDERDRIIQAQEDVRRQVARNLHDGTVQFLSAIAMGIDHMERLLDFKPEAARSELEALRDLTRQATQQARLALFELRPLILETQGLVAALEAYVQQLEGSEEFDVHLDVANTIPDVDSSIGATIFTIVQEAVNNAKKHAAARDVWLRLSHDNGWMQIMVEDNGKGFDAEAVERNYDQRGSFGLLNMRERAELIDGYLEIESETATSRHGTKVTLHVPILEIEDEAKASGGVS